MFVTLRVMTLALVRVDWNAMFSTHYTFNHTAYLLNTENMHYSHMMDGRGLFKNQWDCLFSVVHMLNHAPWLRMFDGVMISGRFRKTNLYAQLRYFLENFLKSPEFACTGSNFVLFYMHRVNSACICACKTPGNWALAMMGPSCTTCFMLCLVLQALSLLFYTHQKDRDEKDPLQLSSLGI